MTKPILPLKYIIGVDPGDSMGVFALELQENWAVRHHFLQTDVTTATNWLADTFRAASESQEGVLVACERYTVTPETGKRSQQPTALQAIGIVKLLVQQYDIRLIMQPPANAKGMASNVMLKNLGFYTTPKEVECPDANDVNDAARHATLTLARVKASIFDNMLTTLGVRP